MDHPSTDDLLVRSPSAEVAAHLAGCAMCRAERLLYFEAFGSTWEDTAPTPVQTVADASSSDLDGPSSIFVPGPTSGRPLITAPSILTALQQVAGGLCALHLAGQSHGDLRLEDIRIGPEGRVQVPSPPREAPAPVSASAPGSRAPEHLDGGRSAAGDRYAFGMLLQALPYTERVEALRDLAAALCALCPEDRPSDLSLLTTLSLIPPPSDHHYVLAERLGAGGMGEVVHARDERLHREVAIKRLHVYLSRAPDQRARFLAEAQTIAQLQHPGIVPIFEHGITAEGVPYYTMPVVRGQTLSHAIARLHAERRPYQWPEPPAPTLHGLITTLRKVCDAVGYAHSRGVVHRDLKPDNIMLGAHGEVWVMDWGLAGVTAIGSDRVWTVRSDPEEKTLAGTISGTPAYMSPEQATGAPPAPQGDVYALGTILYVVLYGQRPYPVAGPRETLAAILAGPPPDIGSRLSADHPSIPAGLWSICERAMAREPAARFATAAELAEVLRQWLEGAQRRQKARAIVGEAEALQATLEQHQERAILQHAAADQALAQGASSAGWSALQRARQADEAARRQARVVQHRLQGALVIEPTLPEAHRALAQSYWSSAARASRSGLTREHEDALALVRAHLQALSPRDPVHQKLTLRLQHEDRQPDAAAHRGTLYGHHLPKDALRRWWHSQARLLCLVGTAGVGKSRLAVYCARHIVQQAQVLHCTLSSARTAQDVVHAVATMLELPLGRADPVERAGLALSAHGRVLLIIDNIEQIAPDLSPMLSRWLALAPQLRILATGRINRELEGAQVVTVHPLSPLAAAEMFESVAGRARPGFRLGAGNLAAVGALVSALDHLPLAIELAAARLGTLSLADIQARLTDRFALLRGQRRDRSDRALLAVLEASWSVLSPAEQRALARCSLFEGGFRLAAAEAVVPVADGGAPVLDSLDALVADHLMVRTLTPAGPRFSLLTSIQAFAAQKLGPDRAEVAAAHTAHYAGFGTLEWTEKLQQVGGLAAYQRLLEERDNLMAGLRSEHAGGTGCGEAMMNIWMRTGPFQEGIAPIQARLAAGASDARDRARLLRILGVLQKLSGQVSQARGTLQEALALNQRLGQRKTEAQILQDLAILEFRDGGHAEAVALNEQAIDICRESGARVQEGISLGNLGNLLYVLGEHARAADSLASALQIHQEVGNRRFEGIVLVSLGTQAYEQGRLDEAEFHYQRALSIHREVGNRHSEGIALANLGLLRQGNADNHDAVTHYQAALKIHRELGDQRSEALALGNLGDLHYALGQRAEAQQYLLSSIALSEESYPFIAAVFQGTLACIRADQGRTADARRLLATSEARIRGQHQTELIRLLCKRFSVEQHAEDHAASRAALDEAETLAERCELSVESPLGRRLKRLRVQLNEAPG